MYLQDTDRARFTPYAFVCAGLGVVIVSGPGDQLLVEAPVAPHRIPVIAAVLSAVFSGDTAPLALPLSADERDLILRSNRQWRDAGGEVEAATMLAPASQAIGTTLSTSETWDTASVESLLAARGFEVRLREPIGGLRLSRWLPPIPIFEVGVAGSAEKIIAAGKGMTAEASRRSAIGEAVERIVGAGPLSQGMVACSTARDLPGRVLTSEEMGLGPRDAYSTDLMTDWIEGRTVSGASLWMPAEFVFTNYVSSSRVLGIGYRHTTGLAAGITTEDAIAAGVLEVLERDAYWLVMRTHDSGTPLRVEAIPGLDEACLELVFRLAEDGLKLHLRDIRRDWPIPIVHALLEHAAGHMPAYSHGSGAGFSLADAARRAITEAIQIRSDQCRVLAVNAPDVALLSEHPTHPMLAWSDPLSRRHVEHLFADTPSDASPATGEPRVVGRTQLLEALTAHGHEVVWAPLGTVGGLAVVRCHVVGAASPDPRLERVGPRLTQAKQSLRLPGFFADPILS